YTGCASSSFVDFAFCSLTQASGFSPCTSSSHAKGSSSVGGVAPKAIPPNPAAANATAVSQRVGEPFMQDLRETCGSYPRAQPGWLAFREPPELLFVQEGDPVPLLAEPLDLDELAARVAPGGLERVRTSADDDVRLRRGRPVHSRAGALGGAGGFAP